jgi:hypothetical protein
VTGPGYAWYRLGSVPVRPSHYVYFFWSWVIQFDVGSAADEVAFADSSAPSPPTAVGGATPTFEVWARIRFEGPGFPHGRAEDKDAISVERVVLVREGGGANR